jgi:hypothetical protein
MEETQVQPEPHPSQLGQSAPEGFDAIVTFESLALWCLGYLDRASQRGLAALSMGQFEALLRIQRREPEPMAARTKAYLAVAREQGYALYCATGSMLEIWHDAWVMGFFLKSASPTGGHDFFVTATNREFMRACYPEKNT